MSALTFSRGCLTPGKRAENWDAADEEPVEEEVGSGWEEEVTSPRPVDGRCGQRGGASSGLMMINTGLCLKGKG